MLIVRRGRRRHVGCGEVERDRQLFDEMPEDMTGGHPAVMLITAGWLSQHGQPALEGAPNLTAGA